MTAAVAPTETARSDVLPPIAPAQFVAFQDACAAAAAIHSARELGVIARISEAPADLLAQPGLRVLDIGAGAAPWSLAIAAREPGSTVKAVDLPAVMRSTRTAVRKAGLPFTLITATRR